MRLGEVQALKIQNAHYQVGYISVVHSWDAKYGLKDPKWRSQRDIPIPSKKCNNLGEIIESSPYHEEEDFVFYGFSRDTPIRNDTIYDFLYGALKKIGIPEDQRRQRNITFHSWRHFYNTMMRGRIPDPKLRLLTGHKSVEMSDHYTKFRLEDFKDVLQVQEGFWGGEENKSVS